MQSVSPVKLLNHYICCIFLTPGASSSAKANCQTAWCSKQVKETTRKFVKSCNCWWVLQRLQKSRKVSLENVEVTNLMLLQLVHCVIFNIMYVGVQNMSLM